jgi:hypothetical protein
VSFVWVVKETLVASRVSVTVASGTTAPDASSTVPVTREVVPCAEAGAARPKSRPTHRTSEGRLRLFIKGSCSEVLRQSSSEGTARAARRAAHGVRATSLQLIPFRHVFFSTQQESVRVAREKTDG